MAILNFPENPSNGDTYIENNVTYTWDNANSIWTANNAQSLDDRFVNVSGDTMTGGLTVPSLNQGPLSGLRNQIINGNFTVWQRSIDSTSTTVGYRSADRWRQGGSTTQGRFLRDNANGTPFVYSLQMSTPGGLLAAQQGIELIRLGSKCQFEVGSTWTLSYYVASSAAGVDDFDDVDVTFVDKVEAGGASVECTVGDAVNLGTLGSYTRFSRQVTITQMNASNTSLRIQFERTFNVGETMNLTGVQFEPGPVATPFENRPTGMELQLCQRYYEKIEDAYFTGRMVGNGTTEKFYRGEAYFRVTKRANPEITRGATSYRWGGSTRTDPSARNLDGLTEFAMCEFLCPSAGTASGLALEINIKNLSADAEL